MISSLRDRQPARRLWKGEAPAEPLPRPRTRLGGSLALPSANAVARYVIASTGWFAAASSEANVVYGVVMSSPRSAIVTMLCPAAFSPFK